MYLAHLDTPTPGCRGTSAATPASDAADGVVASEQEVMSPGRERGDGLVATTSDAADGLVASAAYGRTESLQSGP